jgi:hypothetical protein
MTGSWMRASTESLEETNESVVVVGRRVSVLWSFTLPTVCNLVFLVVLVVVGGLNLAVSYESKNDLTNGVTLSSQSMQDAKSSQASACDGYLLSTASAGKRTCLTYVMGTGLMVRYDISICENACEREQYRLHATRSRRFLQAKQTEDRLEAFNATRRRLQTTSDYPTEPCNDADGSPIYHLNSANTRCDCSERMLYNNEYNYRKKEARILQGNDYKIGFYCCRTCKKSAQPGGCEDLGYDDEISDHCQAPEPSTETPSPLDFSRQVETSCYDAYCQSYQSGGDSNSYDDVSWTPQTSTGNHG